MIKTILVLLLLSLNAYSAPVTLETLQSYADKESYKDNRKSIQKDKMYSAAKGCCGADPYSTISGYAGPKTFKQVVLTCDQCGTKEITKVQSDLCQTEFKKLYKLFTEKEASENLITQLPTSGLPKKKDLDSGAPGLNLKISSFGLKCDGNHGVQLRIDFFNK